MQIGEFVKVANSTKDTVRHYEKLGLIQPKWNNRRRIYYEKDIRDYDAIKEMQALGMSLKEIQFMFEIKRNKGCSSPELLQSILDKLKEKKHYFAAEEKRMKHQKEEADGFIRTLQQFV